MRLRKVSDSYRQTLQTDRIRRRECLAKKKKKKAKVIGDKCKRSSSSICRPRRVRETVCGQYVWCRQTPRQETLTLWHFFHSLQLEPSSSSSSSATLNRTHSLALKRSLLLSPRVLMPSFIYMCLWYLLMMMVVVVIKHRWRPSDSDKLTGQYKKAGHHQWS